MDEVLKGLSVGGATSATLRLRRGAEQRYGAAYQRLVRAGEKPQIRGKYRA